MDSSINNDVGTADHEKNRESITKSVSYYEQDESGVNSSTFGEISNSNLAGNSMNDEHRSSINEDDSCFSDGKKNSSGVDSELCLMNTETYNEASFNQEHYYAEHSKPVGFAVNQPHSSPKQLAVNPLQIHPYRQAQGYWTTPYQGPTPGFDGGNSSVEMVASSSIPVVSTAADSAVATTLQSIQSSGDFQTLHTSPHGEPMPIGQLPPVSAIQGDIIQNSTMLPSMTPKQGLAYTAVNGILQRPMPPKSPFKLFLQECEAQYNRQFGKADVKWKELEMRAKTHWDSKMTDQGERSGYIQLAAEDNVRYEVEQRQYDAQLANGTTGQIPESIPIQQQAFAAPVQLNATLPHNPLHYQNLPATYAPEQNFQQKNLVLAIEPSPQQQLLQQQLRLNAAAAAQVDNSQQAPHVDGNTYDYAVGFNVQPSNAQMQYPYLPALQKFQTNGMVQNMEIDAKHHVDGSRDDRVTTNHNFPQLAGSTIPHIRAAEIKILNPNTFLPKNTPTAPKTSKITTPENKKPTEIIHTNTKQPSIFNSSSLFLQTTPKFENPNFSTKPEVPECLLTTELNNSRTTPPNKINHLMTSHEIAQASDIAPNNPTVEITSPSGEASGKVKKSRKPRDPNEPRKPPTAFFLFMKANRERIKLENPEAKVTNVAKIAGNEWREMDKEAREEYNYYAILKTLYDQQMDSYRKGEPYTGRQYNDVLPERFQRPSRNSYPKKRKLTVDDTNTLLQQAAAAAAAAAPPKTVRIVHQPPQNTFVDLVSSNSSSSSVVAATSQSMQRYNEINLKILQPNNKIGKPKVIRTATIAVEQHEEEPPLPENTRVMTVDELVRSGDMDGNMVHQKFRE